MSKGKDLTVVPQDYIVRHIKSDVRKSQFQDGDYVCVVTVEYDPLVRCRECIHSGESLAVGCVYCYEMDRAMDENGYCSEGDRK